MCVSSSLHLEFSQTLLFWTVYSRIVINSDARRHSLGNKALIVHFKSSHASITKTTTVKTAEEASVRFTAHSAFVNDTTCWYKMYLHAWDVAGHVFVPASLTKNQSGIVWVEHVMIFKPFHHCLALMGLKWICNISNLCLLSVVRTRHISLHACTQLHRRFTNTWEHGGGP